MAKTLKQKITMNKKYSSCTVFFVCPVKVILFLDRLLFFSSFAIHDQSNWNAGYYYLSIERRGLETADDN